MRSRDGRLHHGGGSIGDAEAARPRGGDDEDRFGGKRLHHSGRGRVVRSVLGWAQGVGVVLGVIGISFYLLSTLRAKAQRPRETDGDAAILKRAAIEVNRWVQTGELPTLGITRGDYGINGKFCTFCGGDLEWCQKGEKETNTTTPPVEFLPPGRLVTRVLSEKAVCWLWYSASLYSRATGGKDGIGIVRAGGVDSKAGLLEALHRYEEQFGCESFQTYPVSLDLSDPKNCEAFHTGHFTSSAVLHKVLWFVKASNGSTGNHIQLVRGDLAAKGIDGPVDVECTGGPVVCRSTVQCPTPNVLASMNVRDIWTPNRRKFDNRAYLLIASVDPLVVFYRMGHLRYSVLDYKGAEDLDFNVHVTNPRFAYNLTNDTSRFIKPFDSLRDELVKQHGPGIGAMRFVTLKQSVMNAMLSVVYAVRGVIEHKELWKDAHGKRFKELNITSWSQVKHAGYELRWSYLFMALDIAFDTRGNAFVLDVNTGPSFYHKMVLPEWFRRERSIMMREAADVMQEVAFKKVYARAHNSTGWDLLKKLELPSFWLPLYNEPNGGAAMGPTGDRLLQYGTCPKAHMI